MSSMAPRNRAMEPKHLTAKDAVRHLSAFLVLLPRTCSETPIPSVLWEYVGPLSPLTLSSLQNYYLPSKFKPGISFFRKPPTPACLGCIGYFVFILFWLDLHHRKIGSLWGQGISLVNSVLWDVIGQPHKYRKDGRGGREGGKRGGKKDQKRKGGRRKKKKRIHQLSCSPSFDQKSSSPISWLLWLYL